MNLVERAISIVAPHYCLSCGEEGAIICGGCLYDAFPAVPERCYRCHAASPNARICPKCRSQSRLRHAWVATDYTGLAKQLLHQLKFERVSAAADIIATSLDARLPYLSNDVIIGHIPAATSRLRARGYDQAKLMARALGHRRNLHHSSLLGRLGQARQVGASRSQRLRQMHEVFWVRKPYVVKNRHILLVDDVLTTGGTLEAAAAALRRAGAKHVDAVVFAQKQ